MGGIEAYDLSWRIWGSHCSPGSGISAARGTDGRGGGVAEGRTAVR